MARVRWCNLGLVHDHHQWPHPAYCLISWHHNCDKFYRESREYSDQDTRNLTAPRLFFTSLSILSHPYTLYSYGPGCPGISLTTTLCVRVTTLLSLVCGHYNHITLTMCYHASGYQHNDHQESRCQALDASFPSGPPLIVRGPSQCSSYFNNSPTPGVYCVKYPQIHAAVNPVYVTLPSRGLISNNLQIDSILCLSYLQ